MESMTEEEFRNFLEERFPSEPGTKSMIQDLSVPEVQKKALQTMRVALSEAQAEVYAAKARDTVVATIRLHETKEGKPMPWSDLEKLMG